MTVSLPITAMTTPAPEALSSASGRVSVRPLDGLITASESSSLSSKNGPLRRISDSVMNWPVRPSWAICTPTEAAALTAVSNEEAAPLPVCAMVRPSRKTVALFRQRCSSRRTISSPYRAVERQCTRLSSSPSRYARGITSSSPAAEVSRDRPSPSPAHERLITVLDNGTTRGVTTKLVRPDSDRLSSTSPNASATRSCSGPISNRPRRSDRSG